MIAFGAAVADRSVYERVALPGIQRAAEPGSLLLTRSGLPIRAAYDQIMDEAAAAPGLEALVLLHQDLELTDGSLPWRLRRLLRDPTVGLVGALGARNAVFHLWLAERELYGTVRAPGVDRRFSSGPQEVEGVDGALLALAPWVVRGLRLGAGADGDFHGYDAELALRVRAHGGSVICDDIPYFHHRSPKQDFQAQRLARLAVAQAWDPQLRPPEWSPSFQP